MTDLQKCSRCKVNKLLSLFKVRANTGKILKTCIKCGERFKCSDCDYKCVSNSDLQRHINSVHLQIKDFECPDCDFKCSLNKNLQQHIKQVHLQIKNFECDKCDYKCSQNSSLQKHIKQVHLQIKDFECDKCDYKCSQNSTLQIHIKICVGKSNLSSGEFKMIQCLEELGFYKDDDYIHNSTFPELTKYSGRHLRFDFRFINHKKVFEFDGEQHDKPVCFGGITQERAEENFKDIQICDKLKDDFCKDNGYKMVRISYKDYPNILSILHRELMDIMDNIG